MQTYCAGGMELYKVEICNALYLPVATLKSDNTCNRLHMYYLCFDQKTTTGNFQM